MVRVRVRFAGAGVIFSALRGLIKHTNKIHHFDLTVSYATHVQIIELHQAKRAIMKESIYFLLKPCLSDVHQVFICSYAVTTLWVKVATVQSVLMFRLLLNITLAS